jgi:hypothetical protein
MQIIKENNSGIRNAPETQLKNAGLFEGLVNLVCLIERFPVNLVDSIAR